jgi:hypothetical protein
MEDESAQQQEVAGNPAKPAGLLYHYTDQKGLLGILENKEIWSTHLRYLNDTSEGKIVFNAVLNEINSRVDSDAMMKLLGCHPSNVRGRLDAMTTKS